MNIPRCRWIVLLPVAALATAGYSARDMPQTGAAARQEAFRTASRDVVVLVTPAQASSFELGLKTLATQAKVVIVAEGVPLYPQLPAGKLSEWSGALPLSVAVEKLAAAYDYTAERQDARVFVLRKRYTDPQDLPDVTLAECQQAAQDVERLLKPFVPRVEEERGIDPPNRLCVDFIGSLSREQQEAMKKGELTAASLQPSQIALLQRLPQYLYLGDAFARTQTALERLKHAPDARLRFQMTKAPNQAEHKQFGYETLGYARQTVFLPFDGVISIQVGYSQDAAQSTALQAASVDSALAATQTAATLQSVTAALNARRGESKTRFAVDAALAAKTVTVAGADTSAGVAAKEIFRALAQVYGLRVQDSEGGGLRTMLRKRIMSPRSLAELPVAVRNALPQPLLRAAHEDKMQRTYEGSPAPPLSPTAGEKEWKAHMEAQAQYTGRRRERQRDMNRSAGLRREAARRLRLSVEPKLSEAGAPESIAVGFLEAREQSAFAVTLACDMLEWIVRRIKEPVPANLANLDQSVVTGGPYQDEEGKAKFSFSLKYFDFEKKAWVSSLAIGNMSYPTR